MELQIEIIGLILIVLALIHGIFPKYFDWNNDLKLISLINKQMMYVHTFFIAFGVFLMGLLCLTSSDELVNTAFGKKISFGLGIFWGVRFVFQFFVYSSKLWKGKKFETIMHILFSCLWAYLTVVFFSIYFG